MLENLIGRRVMLSINVPGYGITRMHRSHQAVKVSGIIKAVDCDFVRISLDKVKSMVLDPEFLDGEVCINKSIIIMFKVID